MQVGQRSASKRHSISSSKEIDVLRKELKTERAARAAAEERAQELERKVESLEAELEIFRKNQNAERDFLQKEIRRLEKAVADRDDLLEQVNAQLTVASEMAWRVRPRRKCVPRPTQQAMVDVVGSQQGCSDLLAGPKEHFGTDFDEAQKLLDEHVQGLKECFENELKQPGLHKKQKTILESMRRHWDGLTLFLEDPRIPLDNNRTERLLRNAVLLRKYAYGSREQWAGELAAKMFSIFQTWLINGLDPEVLLLDYFNECSRPGQTATGYKTLPSLDHVCGA